jgi:hypothetical protein
MIFLLALIPATMLTVAGYFVLFLSHRAEGSLRSFGRYLGIWAFALAGLVALGGLFAAGHMHGAHPGMWGSHEGVHCPWMDRRDGDRLDERRERRSGGTAPEQGAAPSGEPSAPPPLPPTR